VVLETLLVTLAVIGSSLYKTDTPREIIPLTARQGLPAVFGALLMGGIFAKVISTANNYLFSPATNLMHDVYERFINPKATEKQSLLMSRALVVGLGILALLLASQFTSVLNAALYAYTIYGSAVTPAVMAVFFWNRTTTAGAVSSIIAGTVVTAGWNIAQVMKWTSSDLDAVYPAVIASVVLLVVVSLATPPPSAEKLKPFLETT
jgi:SSS family solute:Na+ symporter